MDETTTIQVKRLQAEIQSKHPDWPQEKARWIAMQVAGVLPSRR
jgi:hypothetical protein